MSVSVEQPLHFSQQPSSPSFSSPAQSPNHNLHAHTPAPHPAPPPANVDMSSSITTLAPLGQQHDREDADMGEATGGTNEPGLTNGQAVGPLNLHDDSETTNSTIAVEIAVVDEDAMDTTPDLDADLVLQDSPIVPPDATTTSSPTQAHELPAGEAGTDDLIPPDAPAGEVVSQTRSYFTRSTKDMFSHRSRPHRLSTLHNLSIPARTLRLHHPPSNPYAQTQSLPMTTMDFSRGTRYRRTLLHQMRLSSRRLRRLQNTVLLTMNTGKVKHFYPWRNPSTLLVRLDASTGASTPTTGRVRSPTETSS
jgi:hypothetical protein